MPGLSSLIISNGRKKVVDVVIDLAKIIENEGIALDNFSKPTSIDSAQNILGTISHTLQDFYSHTNWVEQHSRELNDPAITQYTYSHSHGIDFESFIPVNDGFITKDFRYEKDLKRENLRKSRQECQDKGGQFDEAQNNCFIHKEMQTAVVTHVGVNKQTTFEKSKKGYSIKNKGGIYSPQREQERLAIIKQQEEEQTRLRKQFGMDKQGKKRQVVEQKEPEWEVLNICVRSLFDSDEVPKILEICGEPGWKVFWRINKLFGDYTVKLIIENTSPHFDIEFDFEGTVNTGFLEGDDIAANIESKRVKWNGKVAGGSKKVEYDFRQFSARPTEIDLSGSRIKLTKK